MPAGKIPLQPDAYKCVSSEIHACRQAPDRQATYDLHRWRPQTRGNATCTIHHSRCTRCVLRSGNRPPTCTQHRPGAPCTSIITPGGACRAAMAHPAPARPARPDGGASCGTTYRRHGRRARPAVAHAHVPCILLALLLSVLAPATAVAVANPLPSDGAMPDRATRESQRADAIDQFSSADHDSTSAADVGDVFAARDAAMHAVFEYDSFDADAGADADTLEVSRGGSSYVTKYVATGETRSREGFRDGDEAAAWPWSLGHGCHACRCLPACHTGRCNIRRPCSTKRCTGHCKWPKRSARGRPIGACRLGNCSRLNPGHILAVWGAPDDAGDRSIPSRDPGFAAEA